jgi:ribosomal-protein-alanine N-acetyltransferase
MVLGRTGRAEPVGIVIEPMRRRHLRRVLEIESVTYERHWSRSVFEAELEQVASGSRHYVVARAGRDVVGYAGLWIVPGPDGGEAHVTNIVVAESHRRRGVATMLMLALAERARAVGAAAWTLEVRASATGAHELYRRFGFAPAGIRRGYYEHGEDAVVMWCHDLATDDYARRLTDLRSSVGTSDRGHGS